MEGSYLILTFPSVRAVSVVRIVTIAKVDYDDPTWRLKNVSIWTSLEHSFGILSACLPIMRMVVVTLGAGMYVDYAIGSLFGRFSNLSTRTAATPKINSGGSGERPVNAPKSAGLAAPAMQGFACIDEEATDRHAPKAPATAVTAWRGDDSMAKPSSDAVPLGRMKCKPVPKSFGEDGW